MLAVLGLLPLAAACHKERNAPDGPTGIGHTRPQHYSCPDQFGCVPEPDEAPARPAAAPYSRCAATLEPAGDAGLKLVKPLYSATEPMKADELTIHQKVPFNAELTSTVRDKKHVNHMTNACCYQWPGACGGGRPYRVGGQQRVASLEQRDDFLLPSSAMVEGLSEAERAELARYWRRAALLEHASIASFERFAAQLAELGAPAHLISDAWTAARDELVHAQLCFTLAWRFDGRRLGAGAIAEPEPGTVTLDRLVEETFFDGCVEETVAAAVAERAAELAEDGDVRNALERIARDEQRHAELAFRTLSWAARAGAAPMLAACVERLRGMTPVACGGALGQLARFGHPGAAFERRVRAEALEQVVVPCTAALLAEVSALRLPSTREPALSPVARS